MAFDSLPLGGVYYPAVSLNRNVQVTLHSALDPPSGRRSASCPDSGEESDECQRHPDGQPVSSMGSLTCAVAAL